MLQNSRDARTQEKGGKIHHSEKYGKRNLFTPNGQYLISTTSSIDDSLDDTKHDQMEQTGGLPTRMRMII